MCLRDVWNCKVSQSPILECSVIPGGAAAVSRNMPTKTEAIPTHLATVTDPLPGKHSYVHPPGSWESDLPHAASPVYGGSTHSNFAPLLDVVQRSANSSSVR